MSSKTKQPVLNANQMPPKWWQVVNQGTPSGDEETKFFKALTRNPKYDWRSIASIANETGLSKKRVEEITSKYFQKGLVFQNPKNEDHWGYWALHPKLVPKLAQSIANEDQKNRIDKVVDNKIPVPTKKASKSKPAVTKDDDAP